MSDLGRLINAVQNQADTIDNLIKLVRNLQDRIEKLENKK